MSHFVGLCFGSEYNLYLENYDESLEVDEYIVYTQEEALKAAKEQHINSYKNALDLLKTSNLSSEASDYYNQIITKGPVITEEQAWKEIKNWGYRIDEDKNILSSYNPDSKWDWYCMGGRWSGFLYLKAKDDDGNRITTDQALVNEVDWDYMFEKNHIPFCCTTSDGEWYERGEMGWFGVVNNESDKDSWTEEFKKQLNLEDEECLVTVIDFHI